jgi:hypothetical protein
MSTSTKPKAANPRPTKTKTKTSIRATRAGRARVQPAPVEPKKRQRLIDQATWNRKEGERLGKEASRYQWKEADAYLALSREGLNQREIAVRCDTSQTRVSRFTRVASRYRLKAKRPTFWEAYAEIPGQKKVTPSKSERELEDRERRELKARQRIEAKKAEAERAAEWEQNVKKVEQYRAEQPRKEEEGAKRMEEMDKEEKREKALQHHPETKAGQAARRRLALPTSTSGTNPSTRRTS